MKRLIWLAAIGATTLFSTGCRPAEAPDEPDAGTATAAPKELETTEPGSASAPAPAKVARIVFVDKEQACDCTRARTELSWNALQAALQASGKEIQIDRIHMDTQAEKAQSLRDAKPLMAVPGLYFLDSEDNVIELLQGEVTKEACTAVLGKS